MVTGFPVGANPFAQLEEDAWDDSPAGLQEAKMRRPTERVEYIRMSPN